MTEARPKPPAQRARVGRVIASSGAQHLVLIERQPQDARPLCAGDVLVIGVGRTEPLSGAQAPLCVAAVTALTVPAPQTDGDADEMMIAEVDLYGTLTKGGFTRGIDRTPALGDAVCAASGADLDCLYADGAPVAELTGRPGQRAAIRPDALAVGFGIVGALGSGKSATLAVLVRAMLRARTGIRPVLLDTHDEYARSFGRAANVVAPGPGFAPHWLLSFEELCWALSLAGGPLAGAERVLLAEVVPAARIRMLQRTGAAAGMPVGLDAPFPYRLTDAISYLDRTAHADPARVDAAYERLRARLGAAAADPRLGVVFGAPAAADTLPQLLADVFGMGDDGAPMSVVRLGALRLGLDRLVAAVLCRLARVIGEGTGGRERVLMLAEDAERYAPGRRLDADGVAGAERLSRAAVLDLAGAAHAGGVGIGFATARPSLVDETLLRAVPTLLIHRLPSETERAAVAGVLPEGSAATVAGVGTQRPRDCVAVGQGVPAQGRYTMDALPAAAVPQRAAAPAPNPSRAGAAADLIGRWRYGADAVPANAAPRSARPGSPTSAPPPPVTGLRSVPAA